MTVERRRLDTALVQQPTDHRHGLAERQREGRKGVSDVVDALVMQAAQLADRVRQVLYQPALSETHCRLASATARPSHCEESLLAIERTTNCDESCSSQFGISSDP